MSSAEFRALSIGTRFEKGAEPLKALFAKKAVQMASARSDALIEETIAIQVPPPAAIGLLRRAAPAVLKNEAKLANSEPTLEPLHRPGPSAVREKMKTLSINSTAFDFVPLSSFKDLVRPPFNISQQLVDNLTARDHITPTPIQSAAVPLLLAGRDVLGCAPTGSGKTLAFLVPLFARLQAPDRHKGVRGVILSPTKELAMQLEREAFFLLKGDKWKLVQHGQTTKDKDIMVTTPARCVNLIDKKLLDCEAVEFIVFDEGDKLWDSSNDNIAAIDKIVSACTNPQRVIAFFSATLSDRSERLARTIMRDPVRLIVKGRVEAATDVDHRLTFVGSELGKIVAIRNLLREGIKPPVLIFMQSIERTKELFDEIKSAGLRVAVLNSKMSAEVREETVLDFRLGRIWVLICTDLLARGVDFKGVGTVINFDLPLTTESYVHRCGRTGRAGHKGVAITFFTEDDRDRLLPIGRLIQRAGGQVDSWILDRLQPISRQRRKELSRSAPDRMVVSTQKRMVIGQKRIQRQIGAAERERGTKQHRRENLSDGEDESDHE